MDTHLKAHLLLVHIRDLTQVKQAVLVHKLKRNKKV